MLFHRFVFTVACIVTCFAWMRGQKAISQSNSIQLFSPVNVRPSDASTGYGASADNFNSSTLNLNCATSPITAVLSSTSDSTGKLLVDNNINLTVKAAGKTTGPSDVCQGGVVSPGNFNNCFTSNYQQAASSGSLTGQDPDNFVAAGGVDPIDVSSSLVSGAIQIKIDLQDEGGYVANSTLYLNTNCAQSGVTGPALVSGNPIASSGPTADQLSQNFSFSSTFAQQIGLQYDLTQAESAGSLSIINGTIPQVGDQPLDPAIFKSTYVPQTSFATSACLIHSGELLANGQPACKIYTLACKAGTNSIATGAQCPVSSLPNELFEDEFDGPTFSLPDIPTPNGPTFHEGVGFLMAKEGWTGGPCLFDPAAHLTDLDCPQNLLTSFASADVTTANVKNAKQLKPTPEAGLKTPAAEPVAGASYVSTGRTTHPNSTFITVTGVPEDLTTVSVAGQRAGFWVNTSTPSVSLSSQPPDLADTRLPGAESFVPSPIQSLAYGVALTGKVPSPGESIPNALSIPDSEGCPTPTHPATPAASVFNPGPQTLNPLPDGNYQLYFFAQDCAGTEELKFTQNSNGYWSTSFYTHPLNIDTVAPVVASGPTLTPPPSKQGTYSIGQAVTAQFSCTDGLSGIISCGNKIYSSPVNNTGQLSSPVDTRTPGSHTFTVQTSDAAGNQSSSSTTYEVLGSYDNLIRIEPLLERLTYPDSLVVLATIHPADPAAHHPPTGTLELRDGATSLQVKPVRIDLAGTGEVSFYVTGLSVGSHTLTVAYSGDRFNPAGSSAPVTVLVLAHR